MEKYSRTKYKRLYHIYNGMKARCYNKNEVAYPNYGGRGIRMCDEWLDSQCGFERFVDWALDNGYSDDLTIERVDVNQNYCPSNCTWITKDEQARNKRRTIWVDYKGRHVQLSVLCAERGMNYDSVHNRMFRFGWDVERSIDTPLEVGETLADRSRAHGLHPSTVHARITRLGWSEERALNTPAKRMGPGRNRA